MKPGGPAGGGGGGGGAFSTFSTFSTFGGGTFGCAFVVATTFVVLSVLSLFLAGLSVTTFLGTSVRFTGPAGMKVSWFVPRADGAPAPAQSTLDVPARYNFIQAAIYRLKLSNIPNRPGVELYPTLEVVPCNSRTSTFLAHSSVPLTFTDEDFDQVQAGNYLVKVIYLPHPGAQEFAITGTDEIISTRLEPGADPIQ